MRKLATAAAVSLALASGGAFGLGLGDIDMRSALNQPMEAEIPLTAVKAGELEGMIVKLADEDAFARAGIERSGALTDLRFSVDGDASRPVIKVTSRRAVTEPFLNFLLEVDWPQGRMVREYTVLLDPPVFMTQGPSVRDGGADQATVAGVGSAIVAPAPIERAAPAGRFDVELVDADGEEIADDALIGDAGDSGEIVSLDALLGEPDALPGGGEVVSLSDLASPNTDAAAERAADAASRTAARAASEVEFEVELIGEGVEVDDVGAGDAASGGEIVSLDALDATGTADGGSDEITVARGDTLFTIAEQNAPDGVSVQQMMLALLEANRSAFINENINLVKAGAILRVPQAAEAQALSQTQALAEIGRQNELWRDYRDNLRGSTAGTRIASGTSDDTGAAADSDADGAEDGAENAGSGLSADAQAILDAARDEVRGRDELSIVADDTSAETTASATADETEGNDAARLGEINRKLQLAREELAATRVEGDDLGEQAEELQSTGENLDALVSLRQNQIAKLEAQLADARTSPEDGAGDAISDVMADAGDATANAAEGAGDLVADAGEAVTDGLAATGDALDGGVGDAENALSAAGQELGSVDLVGDDSDADAGADAGVDADAAADATAATAAAAQGPWYRNLLQDPTRLAIAGAGILGVLGLLGTLLWRRRRKDDDDPLAGFHDDVDFIDDDETADLQAEVSSQSAVTGAAFAGDGDVRDAESRGIGKTAGVAGVAGAAGAAALGGRGDEAVTREVSAIDLEEEEIDKDDTISEVDVYLAYGLHGQAEELLNKAIERKPDNVQYAEKLLQTYHAQGNGEGFQRTATDYHARFGGDANPAWPGIATMGRELRPNEALFAGAAGSVAAVGSGRLDGPQLDDDDFLLGDGSESSSSVSRDFGAAEETLDPDVAEGGGHGTAFDAADETDDESPLMDQSLDPAFAFDESDLEATGDFSQIASELAAEGDGSLDFPSLDGVGGDAAAGGAAGGAVAGAAVSDRTGQSTGQRPMAEMPDTHSLDDALTLDELDLDSTASLAANDTQAIDDLSLDLDDLSDSVDMDATSVDGGDFLDGLGAGGTAAGGSLDTAADELDGLDIMDLTADNELLNGTGAPLGDADEMDTMMDLAKAYIDMGDKDSASNALGEIVKGGSPEQVSEAETLLRKIS